MLRAWTASGRPEQAGVRRLYFFLPLTMPGSTSETM